jgi:amidase
MLKFEEYRRYDALGLAELVKKGEVTPLELLETAIQRTEEINPTINSVVHKLYDEGRALATQVDRNAPFAGVPFLLKDLGMEVKGQPKCMGSRGLLNYKSPQDSLAYTRMRAAGLVLFGKTNTPEFGLTPYTEPALFGPTRNPNNPAYTAGGSSGGSAAAVASGITPIASANDGGGSIRIPASSCGLFGLKPTRGRVTWAPFGGSLWNDAASEGCVSRSVRDSAAYLDAIQGAGPGDPYILQAPARPYLQEVATAPGKLRIGYSTTHTLGHEVDADCIKALMETVNLLRAEGHTVEEAALPYEKEDLTKAFLVIIGGEMAADVRRMAEFLGRAPKQSELEPNTYAVSVLGAGFTAGDFAYARSQWELVGRRVAVFHEKYDLLLTPTLAHKPFKIGALQNTAVENVLVKIINTFKLSSLMRMTSGPLAEKIYDYMPWTAFANMTGQPSMSLPLFRAEGNLPVGVMFTAPVGAEDMLFRLAGQIEKVAPWDQ